MPDGDAGTRPFPFSGEEAARLAREVQNLGFDSARLVVDRFVEMFERFSNDTVPDAHNGTNSSPGRAVQLRMRTDGGEGRALRSEAERALDSYLAVLRRLNEAGLAMLDGARRESPPDGTEALALPGVSPGGRASARVWLHNTSTSAIVVARPWTPGLTSHNGQKMPAGSVTFSPSRIEHLNPGESCELLVMASVGGDATLGSYHGLILVEHLPEIAFPLRIEVVAGRAAP
jgi:hypothetical protein